MKAVVYSIKPFEKELLAKANQKKHDITLIGNPLSLESAMYAKGKEAVIVFTNEAIPEQVISRLADLGVRHLATCATSTRNTEREGNDKSNNKFVDSIAYSPGTPEIARQTIKNLDQWQEDISAGKHATIQVIAMKTNLLN
ncbi:lactate dehydrogenase [Mucilaginibacter sp.]|uniref:lactate dehydrogenase n=1 Tax=Mucilaginibacter sp. TaxID=1882438 RepID=UPI00374CCB01